MNLYRYCFAFASCFIVFKSTAQVTTTQFPQSFVGNWKGNMSWQKGNSAAQQFTMQLKVQPIDTTGIYTWQIIYGEKEQDSRPYLLKRVDTTRGHWVIDERNGIILDNFVHGNCIQGAFTVTGNTIINNFCVEDKLINIEFISVKLGDKKTSGKGTEDSPVVDSYIISSYQKGILYKVN